MPHQPRLLWPLPTELRLKIDSARVRSIVRHILLYALVIGIWAGIGVGIWQLIVSNLPTNTKVAIGVGAIAGPFIILLVPAVWLCCRRRNFNTKYKNQQAWVESSGFLPSQKSPKLQLEYWPTSIITALTTWIQIVAVWSTVSGNCFWAADLAYDGGVRAHATPSSGILFGAAQNLAVRRRTLLQATASIGESVLSQSRIITR